MLSGNDTTKSFLNFDDATIKDFDVCSNPIPPNPPIPPISPNTNMLVPQSTHPYYKIKMTHDGVEDIMDYCLPYCFFWKFLTAY